jgi:hypothetical protein
MASESLTARNGQLKPIRLEKFPLSIEELSGQLALVPKQLSDLFGKSVPLGGLVDLIHVRELSAHFRDLQTEFRGPRLIGSGFHVDRSDRKLPCSNRASVWRAAR